MKRCLFFVLSLSLSVAYAEKQPVSRYQSIIDRQMFGPLPPGFDPTKSPSEVQKSTSAEEKQLSQEQEKLQSSIHFSVINVTSDGATAVGFTDNSDPKAPVHYYLKVGEKRNGWEVKEADPEKATMTIAKDDIEVSLTLGGNSAKDGGTAKASGGLASSAGSRHAGLLGARAGLLGGGSLRARRLQRQQEEEAAAAKRQEELAAKEAERRAQAEQEKAQREAERAEQRAQLLAIQEELKRVREAKAAEAPTQKESGEAGDANNETE